MCRRHFIAQDSVIYGFPFPVTSQHDQVFSLTCGHRQTFAREEDQKGFGSSREASGRNSQGQCIAQGSVRQAASGKETKLQGEYYEEGRWGPEEGRCACEARTERKMAWSLSGMPDATAAAQLRKEQTLALQRTKF